MLKVLLLVVCAVTLAAGHICIVRPAQRGGVTNEALATEGMTVYNVRITQYNNYMYYTAF